MSTKSNLPISRYDPVIEGRAHVRQYQNGNPPVSLYKYTVGDQVWLKLVNRQLDGPYEIIDKQLDEYQEEDEYKIEKIIDRRVYGSWVHRDDLQRVRNETKRT